MIVIEEGKESGVNKIISKDKIYFKRIINQLRNKLGSVT